jgi:hypothetical protein
MSQVEKTEATVRLALFLKELDDLKAYKIAKIVCDIFSMSKKQNDINLMMCNIQRSDIQIARHDAFEEKSRKKMEEYLKSILNEHIVFVVNHDPRGYAYKIETNIEHPALKHLDKDWGGSYIIA